MAAEIIAFKETIMFLSNPWHIYSLIDRYIRRNRSLLLCFHKFSFHEPKFAHGEYFFLNYLLNYLLFSQYLYVLCASLDLPSIPRLSTILYYLIASSIVLGFFKRTQMVLESINTLIDFDRHKNTS